MNVQVRRGMKLSVADPNRQPLGVASQTFKPSSTTGAL